MQVQHAAVVPLARKGKPRVCAVDFGDTNQ